MVVGASRFGARDSCFGLVSDSWFGVSLGVRVGLGVRGWWALGWAGRLRARVGSGAHGVCGFGLVSGSGLEVGLGVRVGLGIWGW